MRRIHRPLLLSNRGAAAASSGPSFANVSLLLHGDARPFIDSSSNKFPVANYAGRTTLVSGKIKSIHGATDGLIIPADNKFVFGTGAWMICGKVTWTGGSEITRFLDQRNLGGSTGWAVTINSSGAPTLTANGTTYGQGTPAANLVLTANVEADVAFSYDGTTLRCFVGGALSWSTNVSLNLTANNFLCVGNSASNSNAPTNNNDSSGSYREVMIVKGEAVYTTTYTPPSRQADTGIVIEAEPNAATYANVKLQLHGNGTNGSTTLTDTSTSARTLTVFGNCQISTAQARIGSSSIAFDGTGDYATIPQSADFAFGTGDYAVSAQMYRSDGNRRVVISGYQNSTNGWTLQQGLTTVGRVLWNELGDGTQAETIDGIFGASAWKQVVVARYSGLLMMFFEGELVYVAPGDTVSMTAPIAMYLGRLTTLSTSLDWNGYLQELRVIKGESPYKRSFTVQTAAYPDS